jgi:hypothetical protein
LWLSWPRSKVLSVHTATETSQPLDADVEVMGRWKGGGNDRVVNIYISVEQLTTDAKVTS